MSPMAAFALKGLGGATVAALLSVGLVSAASPSPSPSPTSASGTQQAQSTRHHERRAIRRAVIAAEADVLGTTPEDLVKALKDGKTVVQLAQAKGLTKAQFTTRLLVDLTHRLDTLVNKKRITPAMEKKVLARIASGHTPFWNGIHLRK